MALRWSWGTGGQVEQYPELGQLLIRACIRVVHGSFRLPAVGSAWPEYLPLDPAKYRAQSSEETSCGPGMTASRSLAR